MTKVITTINLKGGVGKTQLTVALAEFLAKEHHKKVLLIDLDPQTNATVCLIDENDWLKRDKAERTLFQMFKDKLDKTNLFDINRAIVKRVSNVGGGISTLDLLPSSLRLINLQDALPPISIEGLFQVNSVTILKSALANVMNSYDFVLIDCPPNLGTITLNGIYISDYFLIPTIPDILSTYGIPQILRRILDFNREAQVNTKPLGIVISMYRQQSKLHKLTVALLKGEASSEKDDYPRVFDTMIPLTVRTSEAAEFTRPVGSLKAKYGSKTVYQYYADLTEEFLRYV